MTAAGPALVRSPAAAFGLLAMVGSAAAWGISTALTKSVLEALPPFTLLSIQLAASVAVLWIGALALGQRAPTARAARAAAAAGLLEPGLAYALAVPGLVLTSAASASVIGAAEPALIAVLAVVILKDRPRPRTLLAVAGTAAGVALIAASGEEGDGARRLSGDLLVLAGTAAAALYVIASSRMATAMPALVLAALQQSAGLVFALLCLGLALAAGLETLPAAVPPGTLALAALSGITQYALPFWLYLVGLRTLPVTVAGTVLALIPVFGLAAAALILGERPGPVAILGAGLVVAMVGILARGRGD